MNWSRIWRRKRHDILRWLLVVIAALLVGFLVVFLSQLLDSSYTVHYPHEKSRSQRVVPPWPPHNHSNIHTFEDEHKQGFEINVPR